MNSIIDIQHVTRTFKGKPALADVTLQQEKGTVLGLVGENGAGKTTLIKTLLGTLKPNHGTVRVFGKDPAAEPVEVLGRMGYMSEEDSLPGWMTVAELQRYMQGFYFGWDQAYADSLCLRFDLKRGEKLVSLSKGQRARAALMATLSYRPELLLLDEPSSGLDPLVRREILTEIVRTIADEGRTVLFSSHNLAEIDRVSDRLAMIKEGRLLFCEDLEELKASHLAFTLVAPEAREIATFAGAIAMEGEGREWSVVFRGTAQDAAQEASRQGAIIDDCRPANIDEIFVSYSRPVPGGVR